MNYCSKCGSVIPEGVSFCPKCGMPVGQSANKATAQMPARPQMPKPARPQMPQPATPQMSKPAMPQMPKPARPQMPQPAGTDKGFFTNAVRTVANVVTGGELNREIERERQQAINQQRQNDNGEILSAQQSEQAAVRAQIQAEREAERARDRRAMEAVDGIDVVRGRAIWNIQPGEIARKISERELEEVEKLKGIIVQEGCTAIIFANGELVSTLSAGAYLFYKSVEEEKKAIKDAVEKAEKELAEKEKKEKTESTPTFRQMGIVGAIGRAAGWVGRIIFGEKKNEAKEKAAKRKIDYARILAKATQAPVMSVYIVSDRFITLTFGGTPNEDGSIAFTPYTIPIGIHNVEMGVSLQMQVNDIHQFATNYLADKRSVTCAMIQQMLTGSIETLLRQSLRNNDYTESGLSADVANALKLQIKQTINTQLYGIVCTNVLSVTDNNQEFERFRSVERELYNTEKELDFMHRTGVFRNRMENEANAQYIQSAQNAEQLRHALLQINKDALLHDDEIEEFVLMLESQKRIRNAKTETEEFAALEDLRGNRLVKQDEMEALEDALAHNKIPREEITQIMRIESQNKIETARMHSEWALNDARTDHDWEREDLERRRNWGIEDEEREREWIQEEREYNRDFDRLVKEDDYDFQKMLRERELRKEDEQLAYDRARQAMFDEDQREANREQRKIDQLKEMAKIQMESDERKYKHDEELAKKNAEVAMKRDEHFATMSAEQIRAAQLDKLSSEAQVAMAQAYGSEKEAAFMEKQVEKADADKKNIMDFAERMAAMMQNTAANINMAQQQTINNQQAEIRYQQQRVDRTQDNAMSNLSQVSTAAASNINAYNGGMQAVRPQAQELIECQCYNCGHTIKIPSGAPQCPDCGAPFQW